MGFVWLIIGFLISTLVGGTAVRYGAKITGESQITWPVALVIAFCSGLFGLLPIHGILGWLLGWVVMLALLKKLGGVSDVWPTGVLLALVARILQQLIWFLLLFTLNSIFR